MCCKCMHFKTEKASCIREQGMSVLGVPLPASKVLLLKKMDSGFFSNMFCLINEGMLFFYGLKDLNQTIEICQTLISKKKERERGKCPNCHLHSADTQT